MSSSAPDSPDHPSQSTVIANSPFELGRASAEIGLPQAELPQLRKPGATRRLDGVLHDAGEELDAAGAAANECAAETSAQAQLRKRPPSVWATEADLAQTTGGAATKGSEYDESPIVLPGQTLSDASQRELQRMLASLRDDPPPPPRSSADGPNCVECAVGVRERKMPGCEHIMLCGACADEAAAWVRRHPASVRAQAAAQLSRIECGVCAD